MQCGVWLTLRSTVRVFHTAAASLGREGRPPVPLPFGARGGARGTTQALQELRDQMFEARVRFPWGGWNKQG